MLFVVAIVGCALVVSVGAVQLTGASALFDDRAVVIPADDDDVSLEITDGSALVFGDSTDAEPDEPSVTDYTTDEGVVDAHGLRDAVDDWRSGEIDTDLLREVVDAWRSGDQVE